MSYSALPLDEEFRILPEDLILLKRITGIQNNVQLKQHLLEVQAEAYAVYPYPCIRKLDFARFKIAKHPAYESVLKLGKERKNAILLDLPCCVGSDSRKLIADGYPLGNIITSDLHADFWTIGQKLFKTTAETYTIPFLQGDIFAANFLKPGISPLNTSSQITTSRPPSLSTLESLTPLQHHVSVIYTSSFFHLFKKDEQRKLAHLFASLLSPLPGSIIFGSQMGSSDAEDNKSGSVHLAASMGNAFAHSPASWREMWTGKDGPFTPEQVSVQIESVRVERKDIARLFNLEQCIVYRHVWSVTRTGS